MAINNKDFDKVKLNDDIWAEIEPFIPGTKGKWGGLGEDNRNFVDSVLYLAFKKIRRYKTLEWKLLSNKRNSYNRRFTNWRKKGIWEQLLLILIKHSEYHWLSNPFIYEVFLTNYNTVTVLNEVNLINSVGIEHNSDEDEIKWIISKPFPHYMKNRERRKKYADKHYNGNYFHPARRRAYLNKYKPGTYFDDNSFI